MKFGPSDHHALEDLLGSIRRIIADGGPDPAQYDEISRWLVAADHLLHAGLATQKQFSEFWRSLGEDYLRDTMQGFALLKPHGYAGDFEMIERIYLQRSSSDARWQKWDAFFHSQAAPKAVRNRKQIFLGVVASAVGQSQGRGLKVLNLGSGPCREVYEFLSSSPNAGITFDCVDQDANAIKYAASLLGAAHAGAAANFIQCNVVRFRPAMNEYDLMWSSGLFDYLPDQLFVALLGRLFRSKRPTGRIVIGNFSPDNSSRRYMEIVGEWLLYYRSRAELQRLAEVAGVPQTQVAVFEEPEGVNLFLDIR